MENKYSNKYLIETGIGLQDVDGLKNSSYFLSQADKYINGKISLDELDKIINSYYENKPGEDERTEEADIVSNRIAQIISDDSFTFTVGQLVSIHKRLFDGVFNHAGKLRDFNYIKKEWVLDGRSVIYGDYHELQSTLEYDFDSERKFNYIGLSKDEIIEHLATFVSNLWQIHAFQEGNTRTTAVFFIKYLRRLGFDVTNDVFAKNAWYFRNALVRANFRFIGKGINDDKSYLILFLRNLLLNEHNSLRNRDLRISIDRKNDAPLPRELRVVELIKANPKISIDELANKIGVSPRTIKNVTATLVKNNKIKRINGKRFGYWEIL
ncbi:MAG: Fic family protein [Bacilli bacterium]|nr:Fic family protein [Bacilli bacterium]